MAAAFARRFLVAGVLVVTLALAAQVVLAAEHAKVGTAFDGSGVGTITTRLTETPILTLSVPAGNYQLALQVTVDNETEVPLSNAICKVYIGTDTEPTMGGHVTVAASGDGGWMTFAEVGTAATGGSPLVVKCEVRGLDVTYDATFSARLVAVSVADITTLSD